MAGSDDGGDGDGGDGREWAISLEDLEPDDDAASSDGSDDGDGDAADDEGLLAGRPPIEPGSPSLENVAFFALGILTAAAVLYALVP